jgi:hypothetical protein
VVSSLLPYPFFVDLMSFPVKKKCMCLHVVSFYLARLPDADLHYANLRGAEMRGANLAGAWLEDADLAITDFAGADLDGATRRGANLNHSRIGSAPNHWQGEHHLRAQRAGWLRALGATKRGSGSEDRITTFCSPHFLSLRGHLR